MKEYRCSLILPDTPRVFPLRPGSTVGERQRPSKLAPEVGLEPTTHRLTADCSTIELLWNRAGPQSTNPIPDRQHAFSRRGRGKNPGSPSKRLPSRLAGTLAPPRMKSRGWPGMKTLPFFLRVFPPSLLIRRDGSRLRAEALRRAKARGRSPIVTGAVVWWGGALFPCTGGISLTNSSSHLGQRIGTSPFVAWACGFPQGSRSQPTSQVHGPNACEAVNGALHELENRPWISKHLRFAGSWSVGSSKRHRRLPTSRP
jgi:hypothetical protein